MTDPLTTKLQQITKQLDFLMIHAKETPAFYGESQDILEAVQGFIEEDIKQIIDDHYANPNITLEIGDESDYNTLHLFPQHQNYKSN